MKKRIWIVILSVVALIAVGVLVFFLATKGRVYPEDGLKKNTRCTIEGIYLDNDTVYYSVVNNTCRRVGIGNKPTVEKKVGDEWQSFPLWESKNERAEIIEPFSRKEKRFAIDTWVWELKGRYRLSFRGSDFDVVGDFEITDSMLNRVTDHGVYRENGVLQTRLVQLENVRYEGGTLQFTAVNLLDRKVEFSNVMLVQVNENTWWKDACAERADGFTVAANSASGCEVVLSGDPLPSGEYRFIYMVSRQYAFWMPVVDTATGQERLPLHMSNAVFAVGYFTVP